MRQEVSVIQEQNCFIPWCISTFSTPKVNSICNAAQNGKIYSRGSGTLPLEATSIMEKRLLTH